MRDTTNQRLRADGPGTEIVKLVNKSKSRVRSRAEHVFAVIKRQWCFSSNVKPHNPNL
jgi:IS5 family transposase